MLLHTTVLDYRQEGRHGWCNYNRYSGVSKEGLRKKLGVQVVKLIPILPV
jgi:hypothetical protein